MKKIFDVLLFQMSDFVPVDVQVILQPSLLIEDACPICLIGLDYGVVWVEPCHHGFHTTCIYKWIAMKCGMRCPIYRGEVLEIEA